MARDSTWIVETAKQLGFDLCGVVRAEQFPELEQFADWLARRYAGEMVYLSDPRRREPSAVLDGVRSVIVCGLNYHTTQPYSTEAASLNAGSTDAPRGWISRYAWGEDYHEVLRNKLNALLAALQQRIDEPFAARAYADTGPVAERVFAKYAGLGWLGKNTLLLNETLGSWLFLGVLFTSLELAPSLQFAEAPPPDLCGNCRQCLDACPTAALVDAYVLDARRCISYLTIELRGAIPEQFREPMGWHVYGCDICQDVCPFNQKPPITSVEGFRPRNYGESLFMPKLEWLAAMSEDEFRATFRGSAMKRTKWAGLVRNASIALGNSGLQEGSPAYEQVTSLLRRLAESTNVGIAESARWALSRIQSRRAEGP
jgi:epoxyqueuosine reductase